MPGSPGNRPAKDEVLARRTEAIRRRRDGWTLDRIAATPWTYNGRTGPLYANKQNTRRAIQAALDDHQAENVDELRALHGMRLESLLAAAMPLALGQRVSTETLATLRDMGDQLPDGFLDWLQEVRIPSVEHLREARMVLADYAKLYGLNAPTQVTIGGDEVDREIAALLASFDQEDGTWNVTGIPGVDPGPLELEAGADGV